MRESAGVITFRIGDLGFVLRTPTLRVGSQFRIPKSAIDLLQKVGPFLIAPSFCGTISGVYIERNAIYSFAMVEGV